MKSIKELEEKLETMDRLYGKGFFNKSVEDQKNVLRFNIRILKDVIKLIDENPDLFIHKKAWEELKSRIQGK